METATIIPSKVDLISDQVAITQTLQFYIDGSRKGSGQVMQSSFHPEAKLVGYVGSHLLFTPIQVLFDWIDENGPAPDIQPELASIEVLDSIAVVRLEIREWSGKNAGSGVHMSDLFTLIKTEEGWKISQKSFHWHA
jgi:hypothetical protein